MAMLMHCSMLTTEVQSVVAGLTINAHYGLIMFKWS